MGGLVTSVFYIYQNVWHWYKCWRHFVSSMRLRIINNVVVQSQWACLLQFHSFIYNHYYCLSGKVAFFATFLKTHFFHFKQFSNKFLYGNLQLNIELKNGKLRNRIQPKFLFIPFYVFDFFFYYYFYYNDFIILLCIRFYYLQGKQ